MPAARINFNNMNDGVDWASALPPHIVEQQERHRMMMQQQQREMCRMISRPMFTPWPLSEDSFPIPPLISHHRAMQESPIVRRAQLNRVHSVAQSRQALGRPHPPAVGGFATDPLRTAEEMAAHALTDYMGLTGLPGAMLGMAAIQRIFATESQPQTTTTSVMMVQGSANGPQMTVTRVEEHRNGNLASTHTVTRTRGRINRSGADFDIITGGLRGARAARAANDSGWELNDMSYERLLELDRRNEPTGLQPRQLRGMKVRSHEGPSVTCAICLEDVNRGTKTLDIRCGHTFHHACMTQWLGQRNCCPTCRSEIPRLGQTL